MVKIALIAALLIGVFLGLETTHTDYQDPIGISIDLCIYGRYLGSDVANPPYPPLGRLAYAGNYKYLLMGAVVLVCAALEARRRRF